MGLADFADAAAYERRHSRSMAALDSAAQVVAMARLVAQARGQDAAGGLVIVGGERLRAAKRVGLLASSMNPLTRAHVALAEAAMRTAGLDMLCWVATAVTIDKERVERATLADRLVQARMYARVAGDGLLLFAGGLYVEQARAARKMLADHAEVALIVGFDKVVQIFDSRYYADRDAALRELFSEAELVVAPRAGNAEDDLRALLARPENRPFADRVQYCPLPAHFVGDSSSEARALAASGESDGKLRELLAPEGLALALSASPYAAQRVSGQDDLGDAYTARSLLCAALAALPLAELVEAPSIREMVALSGEWGAGGVALRAWVRSGGPHTLAGLRAALSAR